MGFFKSYYFIIIPYIRYKNGNRDMLDACKESLVNLGANTDIDTVIDEEWDTGTGKLKTVPGFVADVQPIDNPQRFVALLRYKAKNDLQQKLQASLCLSRCTDLGYWSLFTAIDGLDNKTDADKTMESQVEESINADNPDPKKLEPIRPPDKTIFGVVIPYTGTDEDNKGLTACEKILEQNGAEKIVKVFQKRWDKKTKKTTSVPLEGTHPYVGIYQYRSKQDLSGAVNTFVCAINPDDATEALGGAVAANVAAAAIGGPVQTLLYSTSVGDNESLLCAGSKSKGYWSYVWTITDYGALCGNENGKTTSPSDADLTLTVDQGINVDLKTIEEGEHDKTMAQIKYVVTPQILTSTAAPRRLSAKRSSPVNRSRSRRRVNRSRSRRRVNRSRRRVNRSRSRRRVKRSRSHRHIRV